MIYILTKGLRVLEGLAGSIAALMLFLMMTLTAVDVFCRYVLNRPIGSALELTEVLMALTIFSAFPIVAAKGRHISVDLAEMFIPPRASLLLDGVAQLICSGSVAVLAWFMMGRALDLKSYGETSAVLQYPVWPTAVVIALGCASAGFIFVARGILSIHQGINYQDQPDTKEKIFES